MSCALDSVTRRYRWLLLVSLDLQLILFAKSVVWTTLFSGTCGWSRFLLNIGDDNFIYPNTPVSNTFLYNSRTCANATQDVHDFHSLHGWFLGGKRVIPRLVPLFSPTKIRR
jgi:hypothetical protein